MKSLADALPLEIARYVHPDWRKNEAAYWAVRDQLLASTLQKNPLKPYYQDNYAKLHSLAWTSRFCSRMMNVART